MSGSSLAKRLGPEEFWTALQDHEFRLLFALWVRGYRAGSGSDRVFHSTRKFSRSSFIAAHSPVSQRLVAQYSTTHNGEWWTRSLPLPVLYSPTHIKLKFWHDDGIWSHFTTAGLGFVQSLDGDPVSPCSTGNFCAGISRSPGPISAHSTR